MPSTLHQLKDRGYTNPVCGVLTVVPTLPGGITQPTHCDVKTILNAIGQGRCLIKQTLCPYYSGTFHSRYILFLITTHHAILTCYDMLLLFMILTPHFPFILFIHSRDCDQSAISLLFAIGFSLSLLVILFP